MRILGIDSGMLRMGFAGVTRSNDEDLKLQLITYGLISNPRDPEHTFNQHLTRSIHQIADDLPRVIELIQPHVIVAETVPVGRLGSNTELVVGAMSACKVIAYQFGIQWEDIGATTVKKQFTGDAKATKVKVRNAVFDLFPVVKERHDKIKQEQKRDGRKADGLPFDVFDAIAIAAIGLQVHGKENVPGLQEREESDTVHTS